MRVSLACALFAAPRLLLLDEPTNHLDLEAVLWLENYLTTSFDGTLLCVSHDRHFLNVIATDVIHFHHETLDSYRGDVASFEAVRQEHMLRQKVRDSDRYRARLALPCPAPPRLGSARPSCVASSLQPSLTSPHLAPHSTSGCSSSRRLSGSTFRIISTSTRSRGRMVRRPRPNASRG